MKLSFSLDAFVSLFELIKSLLQIAYSQNKHMRFIFTLNFIFDNYIKLYLKSIYKTSLLRILTPLAHSRIFPIFQQCLKRFDQDLDHVVIKLNRLIFELFIIITIFYKFPDICYKFKCLALCVLRGLLFHGRIVVHC
jgi:hypothetical protein